MNRNRRCALLAPVLVSAVALPPTAVAADRAPAAPAAPSCRLVEVPLGEDGTEYDLRLLGFPAKQSVRIDGPRVKVTTRVDAKGALTREDVAHGTYRVTFKDRRITCLSPRPGTKGNVQVTKVEITKVFTPQPTKVNCGQPNKVELDGEITATGTGKVTFTWQGKDIVAQQGSVEFTGKEKIHSVLGSLTVPPQAPNTKSVVVIVNLVTINPGAAEPIAATKELTLDCN
ncbi:hypothetical protein [Streptomyces sp. NPDC002054]|uniref:hypothetical protein n=1 Tax=Streptomyces sp. NPDC002054 TaxID=3154663 RepID=UPI003329EA40